MALARFTGELAAAVIAVAASGGPLWAMGWTEWPGPSAADPLATPLEADPDGWIDVDGTWDGASLRAGRIPGALDAVPMAEIFKPFRDAHPPPALGDDLGLWAALSPPTAGNDAEVVRAPAIVVSELARGSEEYVELVLGGGDGRDNAIVLTDTKEAADGVEPSSTGWPQGSARWRLEGAANGNTDLGRSASVCACPGQGGSGRSDLVVATGSDMTGDPARGDGIVLYTEFLTLPAGFERWGLSAASGISEPGTLTLLAGGAVGLHLMRRRRRRGAVVVRRSGRART